MPLNRVNSPSSSTLRSFSLGSWKIEPLSGTVTGPNGETGHLEPKVMEVLVGLAESPNQVVTREQLLATVWRGSVGSDEQLTRAIGELRRAFHDDPSHPRFIETVPKRGYRLIQAVRPTEETGKEATAATGPIARFSGRKASYLAISLLLLGLLYVVLDELVINPTKDKAIAIEKSIAVLPFVNMSDDSGFEYFSDGITEEIINLLTNVPDLKVIGRSSSFAFKGKNEDLRAIGRALGVKSLLEGSVRKSGNKVRVTAQLVDASDGTHIWSQTYDRVLDDVFVVQEEVASAVIASLKLHTAESPRGERAAHNWEAYSSFLQARAAVNRLDWKQAATLLEEVVHLDPKFAEAHELLALCYYHMGSWWLSEEEARRRAYGAAATAISIDPDLLFSQTLYQTGGGSASYVKVLEVLDWAYSENQSNPSLLDRLVYNLTYGGYLDEASRVAERYVQIDPLSLDANLDLFAALYAIGRADEASRTLDLIENMGLRPNNWMWTIAGIELVEGRDESAIDYFESFLRQQGHTNTGWVREIVTGARDPVSGQAYLDQRIPEIAKSLSESDSYNWRLGLDTWYLYFGFIDRYYELILTADRRADMWANSVELIWHGHVLRRLGFTAHPEYLGLAKDLGLVDLWEKRGPPDYCRKVDDRWTCD